MTKYLKENLNFKNNKIISNWKKNIYDIRNEIVHSGQIYISDKEACEAMESYEKARNYICDLLVKQEYLDKNYKADLNLFKKNNYKKQKFELDLNFFKKNGLIDESCELITE